MARFDCPERADRVLWIGGRTGHRGPRTMDHTLFGATYCVLAPEHKLLPGIVAPEARPAVDAYVARAEALGEAARTDAGRGEDRRVHRRPRHQPGQRRPPAGVGRRLRAGELRHRRHHGGTGARPAGPRLRPCLRPAGREGGGRRRGRAGGGPRGRRPHGELLLPGRAERGGGQAGDGRLAAGTRRRHAEGHLPPARLAVLPPALLGRADPCAALGGRLGDAAAGG